MMFIAFFLIFLAICFFIFGTRIDYFDLKLFSGMLAVAGIGAIIVTVYAVEVYQRVL